MEITTTEPPAASAGTPYESCHQCAAPLEHDQRYCVVCGTRSRLASDPSARFLASAANRARMSAPGVAPRAAVRGGRRRAGLGTALVIAVVPVAVALGVLVGRAGNGPDASLLAALRAQKAQVVNIAGGPGAAVPAARANGAVGHRSQARNGSGQALSKTRYGTFHSVAGLSKPTQTQLNQSAQIVRHVQSTIDKSYVNSQKNLPNVISVP